MKIGNIAGVAGAVFIRTMVSKGQIYRNILFLLPNVIFVENLRNDETVPIYSAFEQ